MNLKLKFLAFWCLMAALVGGSLFLAGCSKGGGEASQKTLYTCGMHPQVIQDHPGNCPICGMKLTPIRKQDGTGPAAASLSTIAVDPVTRQNMDIRTTEIVRGPLRRTLRTVGTIAYNETALADVTTKFKGWIEKLYVDSTGQQVHRGDPLFEIYSPDLFSAQVEYLLTLQQSGADPGRENLRDSALSKLKFFDISDAQIAELEKAGKPAKTLKILAPIDGFVTEKMAVEGQMVDMGMRLYRLADLALVWVYAEVYEQDLPYIQLGQEAVVRLSYLPDREFRGRVTYIYPNVDEMTRTARVRMEFHNPGYFLKPGMFATVRVISELKPSAVLVPDSAVLRSGEKNTVFVALDEGKFEPRTVSLGQLAEGDRYEVLAGLQAGERVVTSGQFMLDSESQLREAIQKMTEPPAEAGEREERAGAAALVATNAPLAAHDTNIVYVCPMPEHVSIEYDHPGKCPICGMTLVPVSDAALHHLQPGGKVLYYTCPMPEHSDVHSDKPGKCPHCGMTLIPVMETPPTPGAAAEPPAGAAMPPVLYTCPMASDADVVSDHPGKCPKCEMALVPTTTVKHGKIAEEKWRQEHAAGHRH